MQNNKRKKLYLGTPFEKKLLLLVFFSAVIPATVVAACMYYLIFHMLAWQMVFPEAILYNIVPVLRKVNILLAISLPLLLIIIWEVALKVSHRIAGPLYRIEKEVEERVSHAKHGPIKLRQKDEFQGLVEKLNKLISK